MTERRYSDEEVAAIFREVTEGQKSSALQRTDDDGLTLAELQTIGREVGLAPDAISRAALSLDLRPLAASQTFLSLPIGVERTIMLDRRLSDAEWEALVGELRTTFRAKGRIGGSGNFREWTNGNLQALLEPTPTGHRLRLSTLKGSARIQMGAGIWLTASSAMIFLLAILRDRLDTGMVIGIGMLGLSGLAMFAMTALRLPGWARLRGRQMEEIATKAALPALPPTLP